ncbi:MAG TPA: helix-turn-helix domain-containing protein [Mycobacterium sp.]|nr:helix-turn-helix domain-containing protein [Mycobacterium sp.]
MGKRPADRSPIVSPPQPARGVIADSWRRARLSGLSPSSTVDALRADEYDTSSRLLRAADPVLNRMAASLDGWNYCVMLADRNARIVATRWGSQRMRRVFELLGEALHGTLFREETTGTNSIATTYELRRAVAVHGDEHFIGQLHGFSCYGQPVIDPHTHRLEGVLSITCLAGERNPLLAPYVGSAAAEIEQLLLEGRSPNERALLAALQRELGAGRDRPTLAIGRDIFLANTPAMEILDAADHALIREFAASCTGDATKAGHVTLSRNRRVAISGRLLTPCGGVVLSIKCMKRQAPQVILQLPPNTHRGTLIYGEPGAGHTTAIRRVAASGSLRIDHAGRCTAQTATQWLSDLQQSASESGIVAVESIHLLSEDAARTLAGILNGFMGTLILSTVLPPDELILPTRQLISRCTERVELTPLRRRSDTIPELVGSILRNLGAHHTVRFTPAAMEALAANQWDGNVRELHTVVAQAVSRRCVGDIARADLPEAYQHRSLRHRLTPMEQAKRTAILDALKRAGGDKKRAAGQLGISRTTLYAALRTYDITTTSVSRS